MAAWTSGPVLSRCASGAPVRTFWGSMLALASRGVVCNLPAPRHVIIACQQHPWC